MLELTSWSDRLHTKVGEFALIFTVVESTAFRVFSIVVRRCWHVMNMMRSLSIAD